jgi:hypothetical protein
VADGVAIAEFIPVGVFFVRFTCHCILPGLAPFLAAVFLGSFAG